MGLVGAGYFQHKGFPPRRNQRALTSLLMGFFCICKFLTATSSGTITPTVIVLEKKTHVKIKAPGKKMERFSPSPLLGIH